MERMQWPFGLIIAFVVMAATVAAGFFDPGPDGPADSDEPHAAERILVKFEAGTSDQEQEHVHRRHGGTVEELIAGIGVQVVRVPRSNASGGPEHERRRAREYAQEAAVEFAEPDGRVQALYTPNDPRFGEQWALGKIQAPASWDVTVQDGAGAKVAILDSGIDQDHEDLKAKVVANRNFTTNRTADDKFGHGTHVAGIVAASTNNGKGVAGAAPGASLMNGKVLRDRDGGGYWSWVAKGITWATDNGARVINMSLGADVPSITLEQAVNYAWSKGVVIVAAAGNQNSNSVLYPAVYSNVIAVAATDRDDNKADFSNYGAGIDVAAPGGRWGTNYEWLSPNVGVLSTTANHTNYYYSTYGVPLNYGPLAGTSMATPYVAGVAASLAAECPAMTNVQIRQRIETATDPLTDPLLGGLRGVGRLNALKAVQAGC